MFVLLGFKAIPLWLALKQGAVKTLTVPQMKNVALFLVVVSPEKNANLFATQATVPLEQIAPLGTMERPVLAGSLLKEMVMLHV